MEIIDGQQLCSGCKILKPVSCFSKNRSRASGINRLCRECLKKTSISRREYSKDRALRRNHGISLDRYKEMSANQGGCCEICKAPFGSSQANVDHDHETGKIRDLLCMRCNAAFGLVDESEDILYSMIQYRRKHLDNDWMADCFAEDEAA